jgi:hypothetical protein
MRMRSLGGTRSRRQLVLLAVAALLSASALLAVGILLIGHFGRTEGRILGTTAMLAGYALLGLPAAILVDRRRARPLAAAVGALAVVAAALAATAIWWSGDEPPEALARSWSTATFWLVAATQTAALAARRTERDPPSVTRLFRASIVLVVAAAALLTGLVWTDRGGPGFGRVLGALIVLDVLSVALQPLLALARPRLEETRLRLRLDTGERLVVAVDAPDLASAAAKAIRAAARDGRRVVSLDVLEGADEPARRPRRARPPVPIL